MDKREINETYVPTTDIQKMPPELEAAWKEHMAGTSSEPFIVDALTGSVEIKYQPLKMPSADPEEVA